MEAVLNNDSLTVERFAEAYGRGFPRTIRFLSRRCGLQHQEAEELAQAAWAQGWESRGGLRDAASLPTWVNSIALNLFRTGLRKAWRREELVRDPAVAPNSHAGIEVTEALRACSPRDSRLLLNRYLFGYSTTELASQEKIGNIGIRVRLSRARKQVREASARDRIASISRRDVPVAA
jgi:RNA polymerase sigma factor (sigma-70 family)